MKTDKSSKFKTTKPEDAQIIGKSPNFASYIWIGILAFLFIMGLTCFYTVETEESAVILRFGKLHSVETAGLHFKLPFSIDQVYLVKTERILKEEFGFRTNALLEQGNSLLDRTTYSSESYDNESLMLTGDLNVSDLEWIVQYQISDPAKFLFNIKQPVDAIRDVAEAATRKIIGNANVNGVLTTERAYLADLIHKEIQTVLDKYDIGIRIVTVKFQDVNPPGNVKTAFNDVNEAEQQKESLIQKAREQYNTQVPKARGEAKRTIQEAEGYALERVNKASGEANRFLAVYNEYKKFPLVTRTRMYLETLEKIIPSVNEITIVDSASSEVTTLLPLKSFNGGEK